MAPLGSGRFKRKIRRRPRKICWWWDSLLCTSWWVSFTLCRGVNLVNKPIFTSILLLSGRLILFFLARVFSNFHNDRNYIDCFQRPKAQKASSFLYIIPLKILSLPSLSLSLWKICWKNMLIFWALCYQFAWPPRLTFYCHMQDDIHELNWHLSTLEPSHEISLYYEEVSSVFISIKLIRN